MGALLTTVRNRLRSWTSRDGPPAGAAPRELVGAPDRERGRPAPAAIVHEAEPLPPARRLIVLILDRDVDEMELARGVWALASPARLSVLYLWLRCPPEEEVHARVSLADLAGLTRDDFTHVHTTLSFDRDWVRAIRLHSQPGDLLVCLADQSVPGSRLVPKPLAEFLARRLGLPVVVLRGGPPRVRPRDPIGRFVAELLPYLVVVGAFVVQVRIVRFTQGMTQTVLLLLSVVAEFGLFLAWNRHLYLRNP